METNDPPLGYNYLIAPGPNGAVRACGHVSKYYSASVISIVLSTIEEKTRFLVFFECKDKRTAALITAEWQEAEREYEAQAGVRSSSLTEKKLCRNS